MLKNRLTFLLIPDSQSESRQLSIRWWVIYASAGLLVLLVITSFFFAGQYVTDQVEQTELARLRTENQRLTEKYEQIRWDLSEANARYQDLVQKEIAIRTMFDLPEINIEERQLGTGGPGSQKYATMSQGEKLAYRTEVEVDRLLRLSEFEIEKYGEVEQELSSLKDRLEHTPSIWPTKGWLSRGYGMKYDPFTGYKQMHRGIDVANRTGTVIIAPAAGVVKSVGKAGGLGKMIVIDHGYGFVTRYGHLSQIIVQRGQKVMRGDEIAMMGNSGYSTGPHLHYEVWRNGKALDPREFILNDM
ncbi:MAG: peptidoglycan DD-metalloendopeptidase family protein [candidate division Zixibacteria bacterium]|jgi:murein DD-endopeptidase MepM/ murein hydrolase activator NlpD|nr:peptidoglycan DD-metalloendopeptidase family protein [candidate division Zixibacteria bacterium]